MLGGTNPIFSATSTNSLTLQGFATGDLQFFNSSNSITSSGDLTLVGSVSAAGATYTNATSTNTTVTGTASTSNLVVSNGFTLGTLSGILRSVAGVVTAALVNLATDVTGILQVANGGTGWSNITAGAVLYGNGAGALATTTQAIGGQILAYMNGVPTWIATTTFAYPLVNNANTVSLAFSTSTSNSWGGTQTFASVSATNATSTSLFAAVLSAINGSFGTLTATSSATLASTTASGRFITGNIVSTSTATSTFGGPLSVGLSNASYLVSVLGSTTAASSATGTAVMAISNNNATLSSGTDVLRLNIRTPFGTACATGTTCPRFTEYFAGVPVGADTGGTGVGSLRLSTAGTGITQTLGAADFAEYMQLNSTASVGDLVSLNASGQYQEAVAGQSLIGVVSDNPAFVGNGNLEGTNDAYVVGFAGVINTTVSTDNGPINAGDFITAGATPGVGVKLTQSGYALGQALGSWSGPGTSTVSVLVLPKYVDASIALASYGGSGGGINGYWNLSTTTGTVTLATSTYALVVSSSTQLSSLTATGNTTLTNATSTSLYTTTLGLGSGNYFTSLLGIGLQNSAGILSVNQGAAFSTTSALAFLLSNQGAAFSTTSASFWQSQNNFFATTSAAYFLSQNQGNAFSTSSASAFLAANQGAAFSTTSASAWGTAQGYVTSSFSTTSAVYWQSQNNFFSTTSAAYWSSVNNFFSTTSASAFLLANQGAAFSTTSANSLLTTEGYLNSLAGAASSTLLTDNNTFSGTTTFSGKTHARECDLDQLLFDDRVIDESVRANRRARLALDRLGNDHSIKRHQHPRRLLLGLRQLPQQHWSRCELMDRAANIRECIHLKWFIHCRRCLHQHRSRDPRRGIHLTGILHRRRPIQRNTGIDLADHLWHCLPRHCVS